jgi:DNA-binding beta-propeller fold protein YncE
VRARWYSESRAPQQVFLSDPGAGEIVVTDYSGTVEKTLTGLSGVTGLALNADSSVLYAAVKGSDQIAAVDTATDTVATTYSLDGADAPVSVDVVGGIVWFGYNGDLRSTCPAPHRW